MATRVTSLTSVPPLNTLLGKCSANKEGPAAFKKNSNLGGGPGMQNQKSPRAISPLFDQPPGQEFARVGAREVRIRRTTKRRRQLTEPKRQRMRQLRTHVTSAGAKVSLRHRRTSNGRQDKFPPNKLLDTNRSHTLRLLRNNSPRSLAAGVLLLQTENTILMPS